MKKHRGFTLIELMVVMAIIAILATAGLSAYTGYIKKARDATRIADIKAIESIVMGSLTTTGAPPQSALAVHNLIVAANNGRWIFDPLANQNDGSNQKTVCYNQPYDNYTFVCTYTYRVCDAGMGFAIGTFFESSTNISLYLDDAITVSANPGEGGSYVDAPDETIFEIGNCNNNCGEDSYPVSGCPTAPINVAPTSINSTGTTTVLTI